MGMTKIELKEKITNYSAKISVIGLGYVGLPVAALFAKNDFDVIGVDIKKDRIEKINTGISPIEGEEPGLSKILGEAINSGRLKATNDYLDLKESDVILIDVETPVNDDHIPEYHALKSALELLGPVLKTGALVIIESTIMPGTMENIVLPILEQASGKICGREFFLGNCPERVMPGKLINNLIHLSRVAGGDTHETAILMKALYSKIVEADIDTTDWITAELVKTVENAYRDVQIAFANEVALICEALKADVWRVRELVRKSPGREMLLPGAGVGGHCIPKDPWLLAGSVLDMDVPVRLIPTARAINLDMPKHMLALITKELGQLKDKKILILGYAYLENSDDTRNSPAQVLTGLLESNGAQVVIHDPYVSQYTGDVYEKAKECDAVALVTAHAEYKKLDFSNLMKSIRKPILIDGRNAIDKQKALQAGFKLVRLGGQSEGIQF